MNIVDFNDNSFTSTLEYKNFVRDNPLNANLNIRASAASEAIPVSDVRIIVSKDIGDYKVIFYDGYTDNSGMINRIKLPTPDINNNQEDIPKGTLYNIEAIYEKDNFDMFYKVLIYPNIYVIQNINIVPSMEVFYGYYSSKC